MPERENPYRSDIPGAGPFVGRASELAQLASALRTGRRAIAAVMGGRGMGKTALAIELQKRVAADGTKVVHLVRRPSRDASAFLSQLASLLGLPLDPILPVESIVEAVGALDCSRVVLLLDEIDGLIASDAGRDLLENLRAAYEQLGGRLGIVIFGGSRLQDLLSSEASPFLRTAQWMPLVGLSLPETATLLREPLGLAIPDPLVEAVWEQTGGHPLLLQLLMERAVALAPDAAQLHEALRGLAEEPFAATLFQIWWDNLTPRGQSAYRTLIGRRRPLERREWAVTLGNGPDAVIEILKTTGVARTDGGQLLPRCALFRVWLEQNHPIAEASHVAPPAADDVPLDLLNAHPFEQLVVSGVARWARATVEFPTWHLRLSPAAGNARLLPEQHFQLCLLTALRQRDLLAEPEPLSSGRGRADLKVRWPADPERRRACIEVKLWGGTGYKDVVEQVLGYAVPGDEFACVVMVDRQSKPLHVRYREECLRAGTLGEIVWPDVEGPRSQASYPAFITRHPQASGGYLRVHHILVQLPSDSTP
ncbi:AAA family ATPase [Sorangium sp. So ce1024]|uniref:AAA family ATPase n=1 Tax=unclassified Sorangium TaxID=2621164 RepID=UPI003F10BB84